MCIEKEFLAEESEVDYDEYMSYKKLDPLYCSKFELIELPKIST